MTARLGSRFEDPGHVALVVKQARRRSLKPHFSSGEQASERRISQSQHDGDQDEVTDVLARSGEDRPGREGSRVALGQTSAGRYLGVIYVPDAAPDSVFVITAYELTGKPLAAYRRRRRKKQQ
jgi:hypothetical protein